MVLIPLITMIISQITTKITESFSTLSTMKIGDVLKMITKKDLNAMNKKTGEELQAFLAFKKRGHAVPPKKGKGAPYKRNKKGRDDRCSI